MQVILQEDIDSLGKAGDIVDVHDGYGRNYLLPSKKAALADTKNMRQLDHNKRVVKARQLKLKRSAEAMAEKLKATSITIAREVGEEDKIFGSVTVKDIADALRSENLIIDRHNIQLDTPIKQLGIYDVAIKLHPEVTGLIKVWVAKK